ncbi:MAG: flavodoxin domain-containing protein [Victivallales bacterium]|nr:flavodoxin domain-containing protein [Victivallales bacterium]
MKVKVIFGSTSGNTENAAGLIAAEFTEAELINVANATVADVEGADLLILGSSTWGIGDLQDDWAGNLEILDSPALKGAKVALFGIWGQTT